MSPTRRRAWDGTAWRGRGGTVSSSKPKPTLLNTGPTGLLTTYSGNIIVTTAGATVQDLDVYGRVIIRAANVSVLNCRVRGDGTMNPLVDFTNGSVVNGLVERCYLRPDTVTTATDGVKGHDFTARWNHITETTDGFGVFNTNAPSALANVLIDSNFVDGLHCWTPDSAHSDNRTHNDGIQMQGNGGMEVVNNNFPGNVGPRSNISTVTSAVMLGANVSQMPDVHIHHNWLGGGNYIINGGNTANTAASVFTITDNIFGDGALYEINVLRAATAPGLPATTGADINNRNIVESDGSPATVARYT